MGNHINYRNCRTVAIVCFLGIMYRSAEQKIKSIIDNNKIDCIIKLPSNVYVP